MKTILFIFITITFFFSNIICEKGENDNCEFIKIQSTLEPKSIYISYSNNNNARVDFLKLQNNSKSFQVFQSNLNELNHIEFLSVTSNSSILAKTNNEYAEQIQWGNFSSRSFSFKWDNELYQPFYTMDQCKVNNNSFDLSIGKLTAMVVSGSGNFSILNGHILGNEKKFEYESNIRVVNNDLKSFKSSFDIENNVHYSLVYDKVKNNNTNGSNSSSNFYLVVTNLNNITNLGSNSTISEQPKITSTVSINIPNIEFKSMGISGYNHTIVISGFDNKSNSTKFYLIDVIKNNYTSTNNDNTTNYKTDVFQSNHTLLFEKNFTISNYIKSSNSKYLMIYSIESNLVSVYNIKENVFYEYSNLEISFPDGYSINEIFSSGLNETVLKSMLIDNSNKINTNNEGSNAKRIKQTIVIVSVVVTLCVLAIIGGAIFLIIKKRNSRVSFKRLDKERELHKYPQDNITILLQNYK